MTTLTAYATSGDGVVGGGSNTSWATARGLSTGGVAFYSGTSTYLSAYGSNNAGDANTHYIYRGFFAFDLSSIPAGATITAATLSLYGTGTGYTTGGGTTANNSSCLVAGTQASTSSLATSDFGSVGSTELAARVAYSVFGSSGYKDYTLNAAGLAHLTSAIGGTVKFATRPGYDLDNTAPANTGYSGGVSYTTDQTGTSNDPKLVVTYTTDKLTSDAWAWGDVAAPYRRAIAEVTVKDEGANTALNGAQTLGSTITVDSTTDFASSGSLVVSNGYQQAQGTYTGKTSTTFTGCSWTSLIGKVTYGDGSLAFDDDSGVAAPDSEAHFPQITKLDTTSTPALMCSYQLHGGHSGLNGKLAYKLSTNGGMTWGSEQYVVSAPVTGSGYGIFGHTMCRMKNGRLITLWYEHNLSYAWADTVMVMRVYLSYSDDNALSWSSPARVPLNMGYSDYDGSNGFGSMLYTGAGSNSTYGDLYVPIVGNKDGIQIHGSGEPWRWETWLYKITDGGASATATKVAEVFKYSDVGRAAGEGALVIAANGDWIMQARVEPLGGESADERDRWQSRSTDAGVTWSIPVKVIDAFANGAVLHKLPEGVLLSTGSPVLISRDTPNTGQTGTFLSGDNGVSWSSAAKWEATDATYNIYNGADFEGIIDDYTVSRNTAFVYAQERANQVGARTRFRWYVNPAGRATSDAWAWSDTATRVRTFAKTTSDTWAWNDQADNPVKARGTSDTWAWGDAAARDALAPARATSDAWAWNDVAVRAQLTRGTSDAWTWGGAASSVVGRPRSSGDTWGWLDAVTGSVAGAPAGLILHPQGMVPGTPISAYRRWEWKGPVAAKLNAGPGASVQDTTVASDLTVTFALPPGEYVAYAPAYPQRRLFFMVTE